MEPMTEACLEKIIFKVSLSRFCTWASAYTEIVIRRWWVGGEQVVNADFSSFIYHGYW